MNIAMSRPRTDKSCGLKIEGRNRRGPLANRGFTLIELIAVIGIVLLLAALLVPFGQSVLRQAEAARDVGNMRTYGAGVQAMANEMKMVSAGDILHYSTMIDPYVGGSDSANKLLHSRQWARMVSDQAKRQGKRVGPRTRSYTLNQTIFPSKQSPPAASWEIDDITPIHLRSFSRRPLLYTGVYFAPHDGAYVWGARSHANPVYSGISKEQPAGTINGKTLVLFVGGDVRIVDFSKENIPATGSGSDPDKWWTKP